MFCTIDVSLYGKYVVRSFLPDGVFLRCDHGLFFLRQLMCIQSINQKSFRTASFKYHCYVGCGTVALYWQASTAVQQLVFVNSIQNKVQQYVVISGSVVVLNEVVVMCVTVHRGLL